MTTTHSSPFGLEDGPVDPLVFVQTEDAPETRDAADVAGARVTGTLRGGADVTCTWTFDATPRREHLIRYGERLHQALTEVAANRTDDQWGPRARDGGPWADPGHHSYWDNDTFEVGWSWIPPIQIIDHGSVLRMTFDRWTRDHVDTPWSVDPGPRNLDGDESTPFISQSGKSWLLHGRGRLWCVKLGYQQVGSPWSPMQEPFAVIVDQDGYQPDAVTCTTGGLAITQASP